MGLISRARKKVRSVKKKVKSRVSSSRSKVQKATRRVKSRAHRAVSKARTRVSKAASRAKKVVAKRRASKAPKAKKANRRAKKAVKIAKARTPTKRTAVKNPTVKLSTVGSMPAAGVFGKVRDKAIATKQKALGLAKSVFRTPKAVATTSAKAVGDMFDGATDAVQGFTGYASDVVHNAKAKADDTLNAMQKDRQSDINKGRAVLAAAIVAIIALLAVFIFGGGEKNDSKGAKSGNNAQRK